MMGTENDVEGAGAVPAATVAALGDADDNPQHESAKYVEGIVFMARVQGRFKKLANRGLRVFSYRRGVLVINLDDGGSLSFYKMKPFEAFDGSATLPNNGQIATGKSKVTVKASIKSEVLGGPQEHYLHIPAAVPWKFSSVSEYTFKIVVPPKEGKLDERVQLPNYGYYLKRIMNRRYNESIDIPDVTDSNAKNSLSFTFRCQSGELAVYGKAAESLGRNLHLTRSATVGKHYGIIPKSNVRTRTEEGMEVAAQTAMIERTESVANIRPKRVSTLGQQEFRCFPLYCYPNTWMTKKDLTVELPRTSTTFHDLRCGTADEIAYLKFELLQASGLPKMDRYGSTDAVAYVVCGSSAFVTDVIPNNCNPCWLPRCRRACILPIHNSYSQVYLGLFDYDGENKTDDFIGRVVLDIAQLPDDSKIIDVTLPLRAYSRVYTKTKLGSIRVRLQLHWKEGAQRAALLSYFPRNLKFVKKRKKAWPNDPVTVACPDAKSFQNIALTIYGTDIPGKYSKCKKSAVTREISLIKRMLEYHTKIAVFDIIRWKSPLLSSYLFSVWMYFVWLNSFKLVPAFMMSLILIFMMRNYLKYHVNSPAARIFGHKSIEEMTHMLLFKDSSNADKSSVCLRRKNSTLERVLFKVFGLSETTLDSWRFEDHAEYPFSRGTADPKLSSDECAAMPLWEAAQDERRAFFHLGSTAAEHDNEEEEEENLEEYSDGESNDDDLSSLDSFEDILCNDIAKRVKFPLQSKSKQPAQPQGGSTKSAKNVTMAISDSIIPAMQGNNMNMISLPDQNVDVLSSGTPIMHQINKMHSKAQKATLHLFDDRVFIAEDREEAKKVLRINATKNPILRTINPMMAKTLKIFEVGISLFRATFNILFWKGDPMLSYSTLVMVFCLMVFLLVFPWQKFFFAVGLFGLGPQNKFAVDWFLENYARKKSEAKSKEEPDPALEKERVARGTFISMEQFNRGTFSDSALLVRNNMKVKSDGKLREVIVPSVPFRYNRFYDWPPDPTSLTIK